MEEIVLGNWFYFRYIVRLLFGIEFLENMIGLMFYYMFSKLIVMELYYIFF